MLLFLPFNHYRCIDCISLYFWLFSLFWPQSAHLDFINILILMAYLRIFCSVVANNRNSTFEISSSSSSYIYHGVGPLVDPFRSHVSRSLFKVLPWFLLPVGEYYSITLGNLLRGILFTCCIHFLLYSSNLSKIGVSKSQFSLIAY